MRDFESKVSSEQISRDVTQYVNMRIAAVKLSLVEDLSSLLGNGLRMILVIVLGAMSFMVLSIAAIVWLGYLIGSVPWATLIVAVVYIIATIVIYLMRKQFINLMIPMFSKMLFKPREEKQDDDE